MMSKTAAALTLDPVRGSRAADRQMSKSPKRVSPVLEALELDGGWLSTAGVALEVGQSEYVVSRQLSRLQEKGLVEHRTVDLAYRCGGLYDRRGEWKAC